MKLLDHLPINDRPHVINVGGDTIEVHRNQIVVWVSISNVLRPLPALLDTGHGHNLSISERHLSRWSGATLERLGEIVLDNRRVVQYEADVRLHRNVRRSTRLRGDSYPLETPQGITVLPEESAPGLPLIGMRLLIANKLKLFLDCNRREVTVRKGW